MGKREVIVVVPRGSRVRIVIVDGNQTDQTPDGADGLSDRAVTERWQKYLRRRRRPFHADQRSE